METKTLGFIGGGRVTKILLQAFNNQGIDFPSIKVCDTNHKTLRELKHEFPVIETLGSMEELYGQEILFIALHPSVIKEQVNCIKKLIGENSLLISLAPKFSIAKLSELMGTQRIVRMIPNATSYINNGYNPVFFSELIDNNEKEEVLKMLTPLGNTFETEENKLEAYAIISAMLPTYFWFQWEEMKSIGKLMGLDEAESKDAVKETLLSAINVLYNSKLTYDEVVDLIPVKPIGEHEEQITDMYKTKLMGLYEKIKP